METIEISGIIGMIALAALTLSFLVVMCIDKICNVNDIIHHPPGNRNAERKLQYLDWAEQVLKGLTGTNVKLETGLKELN